MGFVVSLARELPVNEQGTPMRIRTFGEGTIDWAHRGKTRGLGASITGPVDVPGSCATKTPRLADPVIGVYGGP